MTQHVSHNGVIVGRASITDIEAIMDLAESAPTSSHWPRAVYESICTKERAIEDAIAQALFIARAKNVQSPPEIVGFAIFSAVFASGGGEEYELENMVVANAWRRLGIGRRLLAAGALWCRTWRSASMPSEGPDFRPGEEKQSGPSFWLEVRASNQSAIAFYESVGFQAVGRRPNYYSDPQDDAILMATSAFDRNFP